MIKNRKKISALSNYKDTKTLTKIEKRICKWNLKPYLHQTKSKNLPQFIKTPTKPPHILEFTN